MAVLLAIPLSANAATISTATIDYGKTGSFSLYKYDMTRAASDGVWDTSSYVSTGVYDQAVNDALGNGGTSYAVKGVEFSYLRLADISTYSREESNGSFTVTVLYGFERSDRTTAFLDALGLSYDDIYYSADGVYYFSPDTLSLALGRALLTNSTALKDSMERLAAAHGATALPETDEYGHSSVTGLPLGLYLIVETRVPEMVTSTCNPFLLSLPTTTIDGGEWNYDVTVYPKNATGAPTLEKTVRESKADTGKNEGKADDILDGYDHVATASDGDRVEYQLLSHLPTITSAATSLSCYTFEDWLSPGIRYNKGDVAVAFYRDARCEDKITSWGESDGKFTVTYPEADSGSRMVIEMTAAGLAEVNGSGEVYGADSIYRGYSECYIRITYTCTVKSDNSVVYGDTGNLNTVKLTWSRTNTAYYDTLEDDAHVYTYIIDLTKKFSDGAGKFEKVKFLVQNKTDNTFLQAELKDGAYYVTGHAADKAKATVFIPNKDGHIRIMGVEDDAYIATEIETDQGYTLLRDAISVEITAARSDRCAKCGAPLLTASAQVNKDKTAMLPSGESNNAIVPLTVVNTAGFNLPQTGSRGVWMYSVGGVLAMGTAAYAFFRLTRKKKTTN